ncbi:trypsin-like serine protease [Streptomyces acidiscabies]|uniref:Trypsin-like serine protease n=1 Tax=Streptomyces acidiscabies TaxID=42234 RepID=A0AAP6BLI9_9ACTN|nr:trypsin-like serine protease [Streptomyces acidiscabies]MBP5938720.1 S1 family peptidase [Streptomyces sp. LBUM 1476]MBZ3909831.1 S1 family peptidase [Streptomyces acidiscabies]MDX2966900.1 trypsin-like serine protease [Streptomyces acidiscabies]MDX3026134.1 trypsin-like serine protease [Streptomyces acidiscabies]MDX3797084.1 trypsin-like serine protease [Streptomyces acidiscabies]
MTPPRPLSLRLTALAAALVAGPVAVCAAVPASAVTGTAATGTTYGYTAQILVGDYARGCSGVLVDTEWLLTAASCFAADPASSLTVPAGKPAQKTVATIGRTDLSGTDGAVREVVEIVPRTDRDVVLARLDRPVTGVTPAVVSTTAPAAGEQLTFAGYGRTQTEWVPLKLHTGALTVDAAAAGAATVTGVAGAAACQGDSGGPVVRGGQLVGLNSRSFQGGCFGIDAAETRTGGVVARVDDIAAWVTSTVGAPRVSDFNCDGVEDVAIADPGATIGGDAGAGSVRIVYGGGKGNAEIHQDLDWVNGGAEAGDAFGDAIATVDYNADGCTDLVVGTPGEDLGDAVDAGMTDLLYGAPGGLGTGALKDANYQQGNGNGSISASAPESGDRMGAAVAASVTNAGEPYVVIGVPGEALSGAAKAGEVFYLQGTTNVSIHQDSLDVPGAVEANDAFGSAVAAGSNHFAVSAPNEAIGTAANAGNLAVFNPNVLNSEKRPTPLFGLDQDLDTVSGGAEAGDLFGKSLAIVSYRPSGAAAATDSILAVGSPGEDLDVSGTSSVDTGNVLTFRVTSAGTYTQLNGYSSGTADDDVSGTSESGDLFGSTLAAVNTAPRAVSSAATLKLAVGVPGEAIGTTAKAGAVQTFSLLGTPGAGDRWLEVGDGDGIPGTPGANQQLGSSLWYTGTNLYVGLPYGPSAYGTLYSLPLSNVTAGGAVAPVTVYQPGAGGLAATGDRFGQSAR